MPVPETTRRGASNPLLERQSNRGIDTMTVSSPLWAKSSGSTLDELQRRDTVTLICGDRRRSCELLRALGEAISVIPASVTDVALSGTPAASVHKLLERLSGYTLLFDVEVLCWSPWLRLHPVRLLRQHARRLGVVAVWPGEVMGRTVSFSAPGRRDHVSVDGAGVNVLRPIPTSFPDEVPFTFERIPA